MVTDRERANSPQAEQLPRCLSSLPLVGFVGELVIGTAICQGTANFFLGAIANPVGVGKQHWQWSGLEDFNLIAVAAGSPCDENPLHNGWLLLTRQFTNNMYTVYEIGQGSCILSQALLFTPSMTMGSSLPPLPAL